MRSPLILASLLLALAGNDAIAGENKSDLNSVAERTCREVKNGLQLLVVSEIQLEVLDEEYAALLTDQTEYEQVLEKINLYLNEYRISVEQRNELIGLRQPFNEAIADLQVEADRLDRFRISSGLSTMLIRSGGESNLNAEQGRYRERCLDLFALYETEFKAVVISHEEIKNNLAPELETWSDLKHELSYAIRNDQNPLENFHSPTRRR
jgi:hypothetical protein